MTLQMQQNMSDVLSGLGIAAKCINAVAHRHLAHYDIELSCKTNIREIEVKLREIALRIKSKTIPFLKIIPELGIVRLQCATKEADSISHWDLYDWNHLKGIFPMLLGEDENGHKLWMDMSKNPHLLVAGGTGSGKSTLLHNLIANAVYLNSVNYRKVEIFLSDPKRVEFSYYYNNDIFLENRNLFHVAKTYNETYMQFCEIYIEMEYRYLMMSKIGIKSIEENPNLFPLFLVIVDEFADLIQQDSDSLLKNLIISIAQKGRAAGIHLVLATQRPSVDVISGLIKANFPARIACKTASKTDSKIILDETGAESLLGRGDAIIKNMEFDRVRFQVAFTTDKEIAHKYSRFLECM